MIDPELQRLIQTVVDSASPDSAIGKAAIMALDDLVFHMNDADIKQEEYLNSEGNDCPACGGPAASAYPIESDGRTAHQGVYCEECGSTWTDQYQLIGFTDLKPKGNG